MCSKSFIRILNILLFRSLSLFHAHTQEKQLSTFNSKLKELTDQTSKLQRNYQTAAAQVEKYKQAAETLRHKSEGLEGQLVSLRKVRNSMFVWLLVCYKSSTCK